jgi:hypothetical protein
MGNSRIPQDGEDICRAADDLVQLARSHDGPSSRRDLELTSMERVSGVTGDNRVPDDVVLKLDTANSGKYLASVVDDPPPGALKGGHGHRLN